MGARPRRPRHSLRPQRKPGRARLCNYVQHGNRPEARQLCLHPISLPKASLHKHFPPSSRCPFPIRSGAVRGKEFDRSSSLCYHWNRACLLAESWDAVQTQPSLISPAWAFPAKQINFPILAPRSMYVRCPGLHSNARSLTRNCPRRLSASRCSALPLSVCSDPATRRRDQRKQPASIPMLEKKRERKSQGLQPDSRPEPPLPANPHPPANGQLLSQTSNANQHRQVLATPVLQPPSPGAPYACSHPYQSRVKQAEPPAAEHAHVRVRIPQRACHTMAQCAPPLSRLCCCEARPNCKKSLQLCPSGKKAVTPPAAIAQASC